MSITTPIAGLKYGIETRGYMNHVGTHGEIIRDAGWFYVNERGNVICRRIGGRNSWLYLNTNAAHYCDDLYTFTADLTAR